MLLLVFETTLEFYFEALRGDHDGEGTRQMAAGFLREVQIYLEMLSKAQIS
jgi:hypothetical protein